MKQLIQLISELKAPKGQFNSFGKYKYRSCEDILEAVKPLLAKYELLLTITDDVVAVGDRVYIKATATVVNASLTEWKDVSFGGCAKCVEAKLYSSNSILPPSYFSESDVLANVKNSTYRMPPHSVLLLRFQA